MSNTVRLVSLPLALATTACLAKAGFSAGAGGGSTGPSGPVPQAAQAPSGPAGSSGSSAVNPAAPATRFSDFAFEVKDATGAYTSGWIIDKLTTFNVAPSCMEKMVDEKNGAIHAATFYTRDVGELAKALTGDDWDDIESQNNNDRENNKKLVEPMIDRFKAAYGMTITVDGDDCDVRQSALWLRYWTTIAAALKNNPPASGKAFVQLAVRGDVRDVKVDVDDATSTYVITAPRDIEKGGWSEKLEKPFRKRARQK